MIIKCPKLLREECRIRRKCGLCETHLGRYTISSDCHSCEVVCGRYYEQLPKNIKRKLSKSVRRKLNEMAFIWAIERRGEK